MKSESRTESPLSLIDHLREARDGWKDEIPSQVIHSDAKDNKFKCRKGWFVGVAADLANGLEEGLFTDPQTRDEITSFLGWYRSEDFTKRELTSQTDIQRANRVINTALKGYG